MISVCGQSWDRCSSPTPSIIQIRNLKLREEMDLVKVIQLPAGKARAMSGTGTKLGGRRSASLLLTGLCPFLFLGLSFSSVRWHGPRESPFKYEWCWFYLANHQPISAANLGLASSCLCSKLCLWKPGVHDVRDHDQCLFLSEGSWWTGCSQTSPFTEDNFVHWSMWEVHPAGSCSGWV